MSTSPIATVLVPTHNHTELIGFSLVSILRQTVQSFEVFVVGDGAPFSTRRVVRRIAARDARVRYFDFPKGKRHGEAHRHEALKQAKGRYILYCCDDDLWLPNHIEVMVEFLKYFDFGHSIHTYVDSHQEIHALGSRIEDESCRSKMCNAKHNTFGPTFAGHSLSAYRQLSRGWHPAPDDIWTDLHMWRQFFSLEGVSFASFPCVTALHFPSPHRRDWTPYQRQKEIIKWSNMLDDESLSDVVRRGVYRSLARQAYQGRLLGEKTSANKLPGN